MVVMLYSIVSYAVFFAVFLYAIDSWATSRSPGPSIHPPTCRRSRPQ